MSKGYFYNNSSRAEESGFNSLENALKEKRCAFLPCHATENDINVLNRFIDSLSPGNTGDELESLLCGKVGIAKGMVLQRISQINERQRIKENNIKNIKDSIEKKKSRVEFIDELNFRWQDDNRIREKNDINKEMLVLESEIRRQESDCWKDIVMLRNELIEIMSKYRENSIKKDLISG